MSTFLEVLILEWCERNGVEIPDEEAPPPASSKRTSGVFPVRK
jgi:hypothetical protein